MMTNDEDEQEGREFTTYSLLRYIGTVVTPWLAGGQVFIVLSQ
jgi:hypothetical protein